MQKLSERFARRATERRAERPPPPSVWREKTHRPRTWWQKGLFFGAVLAILRLGSSLPTVAEGLRRRGPWRITKIIGAAMHVEPVVLWSQIEDRRNPDDAVVSRLIAQLGRCVRRDCSQSLAELSPEVGLTRLHDPQNGPHGQGKISLLRCLGGSSLCAVFRRCRSQVGIMALHRSTQSYNGRSGAAPYALNQRTETSPSSTSASSKSDSRTGTLHKFANPVPTTVANRQALFLCYRRNNTQHAAGRLHDRLVEAYGPERVFMDIDSTPLGIDFVDHVFDQIARWAAVVVLIGRQWLKIKDKNRRSGWTTRTISSELRLRPHCSRESPSFLCLSRTQQSRAPQTSRTTSVCSRGGTASS